MHITNVMYRQITTSNGQSNAPARPQTRVTVTVTYGHPRLLGLPYVVEMCRKILAVLCRNNLLVHKWSPVIYIFLML